MAFDATEQKVAVPCRRLDELVRGEAVSMLKVDVEGFELLVLQGAVETLAGCRDRFCTSKTIASEKSKELIDWLWSRTIGCGGMCPRCSIRNNFFHNDEDHYNGVASFNMLWPAARARSSGRRHCREILVNTHP